MSQDSESVKDLALREVGRAIVNLQRLEHNLKLAARLGPLEGILPKIQRDIEKRAERAATFTLGQAIQAWLVAAHSEPTEIGGTQDLFDGTMQITMSLVPDVEVRNAHGVALRTLLGARNNLIHGGLVSVAWDSPEECKRLIENLDALNSEIRVQMDFITSILRAFAALKDLRYEDIEAELEEQLRLTESTDGAVGDA